MHWASTPIHVIDFEGTKASGILEYGIVTLHNNQIVQTFSRLCKPTGIIPSQDIRKHGIRANDTQDALPFSIEWNLFASLRSSGPLGAHHAQTENMLLKNIWPYPKTSPDFLNYKKSSTSWGPWIDTCRLFKNLYPQLESYNLTYLINIFLLSDQLSKITEKYCPPSRKKPHCALYDALASALLLQYIANLPQFARLSTEWLLINSAPQEKRESLEQRTF